MASNDKTNPRPVRATQPGQKPPSPFFLALLALMILAIAAAIYMGRQKSAFKNQEQRDGETSRELSSPTIRKFPRPTKRNSEVEQILPVPPDATVAQLLAQLNDSTAPIQARRAAGRALARIASHQVLDAAKTALGNAVLPSQIKAAIAEGLGENSLPEARAALESLLAEKDEIVARGAVRGLALRDDAGAVDTLLKLLSDGQRPKSVRTEAALALGDMNQPSATPALLKAMSEIQDEGIAEFILEGLGQKPLSETEEFFRNYLSTQNFSSDLRVAAVEALANAQGDPTTLLMKYAADTDPEVRMAAGFSLASTDQQGSAGGALLDLLERETDAEVRAKFYQALGNQADTDFAKAFALVKNEADATAKLAGMNLLAQSLKTSREITDYFNQTGLAELKSVALQSERLHDRLSATTTLRKLNSAESLAALQELAGQSTDPKVVEAANSALQARARRQNR